MYLLLPMTGCLIDRFPKFSPFGRDYLILNDIFSESALLGLLYLSSQEK